MELITKMWTDILYVLLSEVIKNPEALVTSIDYLNTITLALVLVFYYSHQPLLTN